MNNLKSITKFLKALSDTARIRIICLLSSKEDLCVCEIRKIIGLSQPTISSHLKILEEAGIIVYKKDGRWMNYKMNPGMDKDPRGVLNCFLLSLKNDEEINRDLGKLSSTDRKVICSK